MLGVIASLFVLNRLDVLMSERLLLRVWTLGVSGLGTFSLCPGVLLVECVYFGTAEVFRDVVLLHEGLNHKIKSLDFFQHGVH